MKRASVIFFFDQIKVIAFTNQAGQILNAIYYQGKLAMPPNIPSVIDRYLFLEFLN